MIVNYKLIILYKNRYRYYLMRKILILFIVIPLLINLTHSCSCLPQLSVEDEFKRVDEVFLGKVLQVQTVGIEKIVLFYVFNSWKGIWSKWVRIRTCENTGCCGFDFQTGFTYLVYAQIESQKLHVSVCSRTTDISNAREDINILSEMLKGKDNSPVNRKGK
jgi:hypothetical protein